MAISCERDIDRGRAWQCNGVVKSRGFIVLRRERERDRDRSIQMEKDITALDLD